MICIAPQAKKNATALLPSRNDVAPNVTGQRGVAPAASESENGAGSSAAKLSGPDSRSLEKTIELADIHKRQKRSHGEHADQGNGSKGDLQQVSLLFIFLVVRVSMGLQIF
jgi:hypothetical protein